MSEKKEIKSITKSAFELYKRRFAKVSLAISFFAIILIISLALGFFFPYTFILTIPFLVIPAFFSLSAINTISEREESKEGIGFFLMFRKYFCPFFKGGYRGWFALLKAFVTYVIVSSLVSFILILVLLNKDQSYVDFINAISEIEDLEILMEEFAKFIDTNSTFMLISNISNCSGIVCGFYIFVHHMSIHSVKFFHNFLTMTPIMIRDLNVINKVTFKTIKKSFYKDYFKSLWFIILLFILGLGGFTVLAFFVSKNFLSYQYSILGIFGSVILVIFLVPYWLNVLQLLYQKYSYDYVQTFIKLSIESIDELKKTTKIDPEKEKEVREFLNKQKEENEKNHENKESN